MRLVSVLCGEDEDEEDEVEDDSKRLVSGEGEQGATSAELPRPLELLYCGEAGEAALELPVPRHEDTEGALEAVAVLVLDCWRLCSTSPRCGGGTRSWPAYTGSATAGFGFSGGFTSSRSA